MKPKQTNKTKKLKILTSGEKYLWCYKTKNNNSSVLMGK